ncbi:MAG: hypothetical protein ETSY2_30960 [Candidatus Entotheonella gemina]|uniref:Uncharacterized protein n=1 Tax=Candidatus Entotheonella gemina TaxID=1429439 RepID=W4M268_9BACT|nr:MAG: hypothetical protein ETSY2_30960 [Candidatus Entotheonella gemina]
MPVDPQVQTILDVSGKAVRLAGDAVAKAFV